MNFIRVSILIFSTFHCNILLKAQDTTFYHVQDVSFSGIIYSCNPIKSAQSVSYRLYELFYMDEGPDSLGRELVSGFLTGVNFVEDEIYYANIKDSSSFEGFAHSFHFALILTFPTLNITKKIYVGFLHSSFSTDLCKEEPFTPMADFEKCNLSLKTVSDPSGLGIHFRPYLDERFIVPPDLVYPIKWNFEYKRDETIHLYGEEEPRLYLLSPERYHQYETPGEYVISMFIANYQLCNDFYYDTIYVENGLLTENISSFYKISGSSLCPNNAPDTPIPYEVVALLRNPMEVVDSESPTIHKQLLDSGNLTFHKAISGVLIPTEKLIEIPKNTFALVLSTDLPLNSGYINTPLNTSPFNPSFQISLDFCEATGKEKVRTQNPSSPVNQAIDLINTFPKNISVSIYPNPFEHSLAIKVETQEVVSSQIIVRDLLGKVILQRPWEILPGVNQHELSLAQLSSGTYLIQMISDEGIRNQVVQKR